MTAKSDEIAGLQDIEDVQSLICLQKEAPQSGNSPIERPYMLQSVQTH